MLPASGSDAVTAVIARIGAARRMAIYSNQLEVMMVDALGAMTWPYALRLREVLTGKKTSRAR